MIIACNRCASGPSALRASNGSSIHACTLEAMRTQGHFHRAAKTRRAHSSILNIAKADECNYIARRHETWRYYQPAHPGWGAGCYKPAASGAPPAQAHASERGAAPGAQESVSLEPGKPVERELSGGQSHSYKITMISGQYLHVVVAQRGIDVAVALFTPDGKKISEVDSEPLTEGSETVSAIADASGAYLIEVRSPEKSAKTGRYEIKVEELRAATARISIESPESRSFEKRRS